MICPNCGNEVSESYDYCPRCGTKINLSQSALTEQIEETRHNERSSQIPVIIGFILFAVGAIVGLIPTTTRYSGTWPFGHTITYHPYADLATGILILAGILILVGGILWMYYGWKRKNLLRQLNSTKQIRK